MAPRYVTGPGCSERCGLDSLSGPAPLEDDLTFDFCRSKSEFVDNRSDGQFSSTFGSIDMRPVMHNLHS